MTRHPATCSAFEGHRRIATGSLSDVALAVRAVLARGEQAPVLIFDDITGRPVELDLRGTPEEILGGWQTRRPASNPRPPLRLKKKTSRAAVAGPSSVWWRER